MTWRGSQRDSRSWHLAKFDAQEVDRYEAWILQLGEEDEAAGLTDISQGFQFRGGMAVLDAGAGTGALCKVLARVAGLQLTALEPSRLMLAKLQAKPELRHVEVVEGFCDAADDRNIFPAAAFDLVVSRQLVNGLFDPLMAFKNWFHWLKAGGRVIVIDGLYARSA